MSPPTFAERGISVLRDPHDDLARLGPYLGEFAEAALLEGEDCALLAAICLRETAAGWGSGYSPKGTPNGRGDGGHGAGLFQIDDRGRYGHLVRECPDATPFLQARWACAVLRDARVELAEFRGHPLYEVAVVCRYNASLKRICDALAVGLHPDCVTTKGPSGQPDYGSDVLKRRDRLRAEHPDRFPNHRSTKEIA